MLSDVMILGVGAGVVITIMGFVIDYWRNRSFYWKKEAEALLKDVEECQSVKKRYG